MIENNSDTALDAGSIQEWSYTLIDCFSNESAPVARAESEAQGFYYNSDLLEKISQNNIKRDDVVSDELHKKEQLLGKEKNELENLIHLVKNISVKLKSFLMDIDYGLIELLTYTVKKISEQIILKEIEVNPNILVNMIDELRNLLAHDNELTKILISEHDALMLQKVDLGGDLNIVVNASLSSGDIVLKNEYSEVAALLRERIDQLVKL